MELKAMELKAMNTYQNTPVIKSVDMTGFLPLICPIQAV